MPEWVTGPLDDIDRGKAEEWAAEHGYTPLELLIARARAGREARGLD
jgi:hypothetical protein